MVIIITLSFNFFPVATSTTPYCCDVDIIAVSSAKSLQTQLILVIWLVADNRLQSLICLKKFPICTRNSYFPICNCNLWLEFPMASHKGNSAHSWKFRSHLEFPITFGNSNHKLEFPFSNGSWKFHSYLGIPIIRRNFHELWSLLKEVGLCNLNQ